MTKASETFVKRIGIEWPIIQAPMAGTSTARLAASVSNAGGLGSLGIGAMTPGAARATITETRKLTSKPINVNVFCNKPPVADEEVNRKWLQLLRPQFERYGATPPKTIPAAYKSFSENEAMLRVLLELRPEVVSFHFGLPPTPWISELRQAGILLFCTVTSLQEAHIALKSGIDVLVAQGIEAGGHRGIFNENGLDDKLTLSVLVRQIVAFYGNKVPIVAAGGIMDGAGIRSALALGASAAQLGTAFVGTDESAADEGYRRALFDSSATHTTITRAISGRPARCLSNKFTQLAEQIPAKQIPVYPIAYSAGKALNDAAKKEGEFGYGSHWAGQGFPLARALPAAKLVENLVAELES